MRTLGGGTWRGIRQTKWPLMKLTFEKQRWTTKKQLTIQHNVRQGEFHEESRVDPEVENENAGGGTLNKVVKDL